MSSSMIRNPYPLTDLWEGREIGDPFLMRHDGRFYLYCSSGGLGIKCWVSEDMIRFDYQGFVCEEPCTIGAYAPTQKITSITLCLGNNNSCCFVKTDCISALC